MHAAHKVEFTTIDEATECLRRPTSRTTTRSSYRPMLHIVDVEVFILVNEYQGFLKISLIAGFFLTAGFPRSHP